MIQTREDFANPQAIKLPPNYNPDQIKLSNIQKAYPSLNEIGAKQIFEEWKNVMIRKGLSMEEAEKRAQKANYAFPDAMVLNYESLTTSLTLPDENDRHVLAAAIKSNADVIVTNNLKDFPEQYLDSFGVKAKSADDFLTDIIDLNSEIAIKAFKEMVLNRKNPNMNEFEVLESLRKVGLFDTANYIHALL